LYDDSRSDAGSFVPELLGLLDLDAGLPLSVSRKHNENLFPRFPWIDRFLSADGLWKSTARMVVPNGLRRAVAHRVRRANTSRRIELDSETRARLSEAYAAEFDQLERLIDRDLSEWRSPKRGTAHRVS
jgi:hypothetical protein